MGMSKKKLFCLRAELEMNVLITEKKSQSTPLTCVLAR